VRVNQEVNAMETAMQWVMRLRDESVTEEDIGAWMEWYEQDERHKRIFDEMQEFWHFTGELATLPEGMQRIARLRGIDANRVPAEPRWRWGALAASIALACSVGAWWQWGGGRNEFNVATQNMREQQLPDGSRVQLAARSFVDVQYTDRRRMLSLREGEAHFVAAPNRERPFIVQVGTRQVRAVGTAFNIRKAASRVVVTVDKGTVDVYSADADVLRVEAGHEVKWEGETRPAIAAADPSRALAWREGRLEYINEPLASVIADVNRYSKRTVVIRDEAAARLAFTGTVFTGSTEEWVQALPGEFPVSLISDGGEALVLVSR